MRSGEILKKIISIYLKEKENLEGSFLLNLMLIKKAIKNAYKHFIKDGESRGKLVLPCGTGKSLTAFWMVEKLDSKRILVAVPSLSLISKLASMVERILAKNGM